jgi:outer membrane protein TolC
MIRADDRSRGADTTNSSNIVFQVNVPLLKGNGAVSAAADENAAKAGVLAAEFLVTHSVASASRDTIKKYWQYLAAMRLLEQARDAENRVATLLLETEQLVDAEQLPRSSLSSVKASLADKRAQVESRKYLVKESWEQLALMFGSSHPYMLGAPVPVTDFPFLDETRLKLFGNDADQLRRHAMENRYDLKAQKEQLNATTILYRAAEHDLKPQVNLSFSVGYQGLKTGNGGDSFVQGLSSNRSDPKWQAMLSFTGPLENRSAEGTLMSRKASLASSRLSTDYLKDQIRSQVTLAVSNLESLSAELSASRESVTQYLKAVEDEREKLRLGLSTLFAVIDAEDRLASSQGRLIDVTSQLAQALVDIRFYSGTLVEKSEGQFRIDVEAVMTLPAVH